MIMQNPFEEIIERLERIEEAIRVIQIKEAIKLEIINRDELCKRLGISEPTVIHWEKKGKIPCFRIGSNVRYNWSTVVESLEKNSKRSNI